MQQKREGRCKQTNKQRNNNLSSWLLFTFSGQKDLPVYLPLLVDDAMGFFSGYSSMEPQLSYMDDCREIRHVSKKKNFKTNKSVGRVTPDVPEFNEEW